MKTIIFDTETTGGDVPQVIEAAWISLQDPCYCMQKESFEQRYRPDVPITLGALAVHHIFEVELADCPPHTEFRLPEDVEYMIGHNVDYDWKMAGEPPVKRICTLAMCRKLWPGCDSHSQAAMMYHLIEGSQAREMLKTAHSAMSDVLMCRLILMQITLLLQVSTWEELWQFSEESRIPEIMPFGKHKGVAIKDVPPDYKRWLLGHEGAL